MRYLITFSLAIFSFINIQAQDGEYDKILTYLVDEEYEKVLYKCEKYTLDDDSKKDPIPYLYMSMAYFEMSKRGEFEEDYPKAFKESLKYAAKYRKKDKDSAFYREFSDFFSELREAAMVDAEVEMGNEKWTRATGIYKYLVKIDERDPGAQLMMAYCELMDGNSRDAEEFAEIAKTILKEDGIDNLAKEQLEMLKTGIIKCSEAYSQEGMRTQARDWMEKGKQYFDGDDEFMGYYREIVG